MTSHKYEINLLPPGEGLNSPFEKQPPPVSTEEEIGKTKLQVTGPTLFNKPGAGTEEKGILTVITQERTIRRAYLNNKIVPVSMDTSPSYQWLSLTIQSPTGS